MGVYGGFVDKMPFGAAFNKLDVQDGQMHGQKYMNMLWTSLERKLDPSFVLPTLPLEQAPQGYEIFQQKKTTSGCTQTIKN